MAPRSLVVSFALCALLLPAAVHAQAPEGDDALKARLIEQLDGVDAMEARVAKVRLAVRQLTRAAELDHSKVKAVHEAAWQARTLVAAASATAAGFREAWPTLQKTLEKFLSKTDAYRKNEEVEASLQTIENTAQAVEGDLTAKATDYAGSMRSSLAGLAGSLKWMEEQPAVASVHANNALKQADEIEALATAIGAIYPWEPERGSAPLRALDERQRGWSDAARDALPVAAEARVRARAKVKEVKDAARARLAAARFPKSKRSGGAWDGLAAKARGLVAAAWKTPEARVRRVGIASDWEERREWARRGDRWSWEHFRFFWADVAVELDGGRCRVYALTFRQEKTSAGWSALAHWGTAESFEMLLDKVSE